MANTINLNRKNTYITIWLYLSLFLVFLLIFIGGLTRLTESGLSITSWELFSGILPPLNEKQWQNYFALYKQIPQYKEINLGIATQAACYEPRHLIICFDKNNKVYGYFELCIECGTYDSSKNMEGILNFSMEKGVEFEVLFKEFGIKHFTDNNYLICLINLHKLVHLCVFYYAILH